MRHASPLRYPGGKAFLATYLARIIELNNLRGCSYFEPYAGGAGAALTLLRDGFVSEIFINDADRRVAAFWHSVLNESERLAERVLTAPLTISEWHRHREICAYPRGHSRFDLGFAAFFMNRCNRSGVLSGAGPIGGYGQSGKWRLDVRFNRGELAERILTLGSMSDQIHLTQLDAIDFLRSRVPRGKARRQAFVYLDPPYVCEGRRLYLNAYKPGDHGELAKYIRRQKLVLWVMSYDAAPLVWRLYQGEQIALLPVRYTLQAKRDASELLIAPQRVCLPQDLGTENRPAVPRKNH